MKWLITCHVWRKPINHPGKISVWNHHLNKLNIFVEHRNISVPKSRHLAFFNRFGGYPLPWKFDEWIPMQNWCLWKKYLQLHLFLITFFDIYELLQIVQGSTWIPHPPNASKPISCSNHQFWGICFLQHHCFKIQNMSFSTIQSPPPRLLST